MQGFLGHVNYIFTEFLWSGVAKEFMKIKIGNNRMKLNELFIYKLYLFYFIQYLKL